MEKLLASILSVSLIAAQMNAAGLPMSLGVINKRITSSGPKQVLLIQDIHANPQVQRTIKEILEFYDEKAMVGDHIFVEGTEGPVDSSVLVNETDDTVRQKVLDSLLETADITGAEYFAVNKHKVSMLYGIDDLATYQRHLENFKAFYKEQNVTAEYLSDMRQDTLRQLTILDLPIAIIVTDLERSSPRFIDNLIVLSRAYKISLDEQFPVLSRWRQMRNTGKFESVIDLGLLTSQAHGLAYEICRAMADTAQKKELVNVVFGLDFLVNLMARRTTRQEFIAFASNIDALGKYIKVKSTKEFAYQIEKAIEFYWLAYERDSLMAENLIEQMEARKLNRAVVIAGGFHSDGIAEILKEHDIGVTILSPMVGDHTKVNEMQYVKKLLSAQYLAVPYSSDRNKIFRERIKQVKEGRSKPKKSKTVLVATMLLTLFFGSAARNEAIAQVEMPPILTVQSQAPEYFPRRTKDHYPIREMDLTKAEEQKINTILIVGHNLRDALKHYDSLMDGRLGGYGGLIYDSAWLKMWKQPSSVSPSDYADLDIWPILKAEYESDSRWTGDYRQLDIYLLTELMDQIRDGGSFNSIRDRGNFNLSLDKIYAKIFPGIARDWDSEPPDNRWKTRARIAVRAKKLKAVLNKVGLKKIVHLADWYYESMIERVNANNNPLKTQAMIEEVKRILPINFPQAEAKQETEVYDPFKPIEPIDPGIIMQTPKKSPTPLQQADSKPTPIPPAVSVPSKRPMQERIEEISRALESDVKRSENAPKFDWKDYLRNKDISLSKYWKDKIYEATVAGVIFTQLLFILSYPFILVIETIRNKFKSVNHLIRDQFPFLRTETVSVWLISTTGFVCQALLNDGSLNLIQIITGLAAIMTSLLMLYQSDSGNSSDRQSGKALLPLMGFVAVGGLLAPVIIEYGWIKYAVQGLMVLGPIVALSRSKAMQPQYHLQQHFFRQT